MYGAVAAIKKFLAKERERRTYHEKKLENMLNHLATSRDADDDNMEDKDWSFLNELKAEDISVERERTLGEICDIQLPPNLEFAIDQMINDIDTISPVAPIHFAQAVGTFIDTFPICLAHLKLRYCNRWTRFTSTLTPETEILYRPFATRFLLTIEALNEMYTRLQHCSRHEAFFCQMEMYLKWNLPLVENSTGIRRLLADIRWLAFSPEQVDHYLHVLFKGL